MTIRATRRSYPIDVGGLQLDLLIEQQHARRVARLRAERLALFRGVNAFESNRQRSAAAIEPRTHGVTVRDRHDRGRHGLADHPKQPRPPLRDDVGRKYERSS